MSAWTVIMLENATGRVLVDWVNASDEWEAFASATRTLSGSGQSLAGVELVAAIKGRHSIATPTDSDTACYAVDYPH